MKVRIAKAVGRQAVEGRCGNRPAEGRARAKTDIVGHDDEDIRRPLRRRHGLWEIRHRIADGSAYLAAEGPLRSGQYLLGPRLGQAEQLRQHDLGTKKEDVSRNDPVFAHHRENSYREAAKWLHQKVHANYTLMSWRIQPGKRGNFGGKHDNIDNFRGEGYHLPDTTYNIIARS